MLSRDAARTGNAAGATFARGVTLELDLMVFSAEEVRSTAAGCLGAATAFDAVFLVDFFAGFFDDFFDDFLVVFFAITFFAAGFFAAFFAVFLAVFLALFAT